jgi:hypothetical protein
MVLPAMLALDLILGMVFAPAINTATAGYLGCASLRPARSGDRGHPRLHPRLAVSAALLGCGVILAVVLLPSRRRLTELRNAALVPVPPPGSPLTDHQTAGHTSRQERKHHYESSTEHHPRPRRVG